MVTVTKIPFTDRILKIEETARMFGVSVPGLYNWMKASVNPFPLPRRIGATGLISGWLESELLEFAKTIPQGRSKHKQHCLAPTVMAKSLRTRRSIAKAKREREAA